MKIAVVKESAADETRVALVPETVRKLREAGWSVAVQKDAGTAGGFTDAAYAEAGAVLYDTAVAAVGDANLVAAVRTPAADVLAAMQGGATLVALLDPMRLPELLNRLAAAGITAISLELIPRTTRAQSMDVLSSQASV